MKTKTILTTKMKPNIFYFLFFNAVLFFMSLTMSAQQNPSSCIDSLLIDTSITCSQNYDPVCGCDSVTYHNSCYAVNYGGVTSYTMGSCNSSGSSSCTSDFLKMADSIDCYTAIFYDNSLASANIVSWAWDLGDGNVSYQQNPVHKYVYMGLYLVTLTIVTSDGCTNSTTKYVHVSCPPPANCQANFEDSIACKDIVFFDSSQPGTNNGNIVSWHWDLGDGNTSTDQNPSHTFASNGNYYVCLTVTTIDSCVNTYCDSVIIDCNTNNLNRIGDLLLPQGKFTVYPNPFNQRAVIEFDAIGNNPYQLEMYDLTGQLVKRQTDLFGGRVEIERSGLLGGIYFVEIKGKGHVLRGKVIVN